MKAGAFLFDLDGTLIDSETLWARAMVDWIVSRGGTASLETILPIVVGRSLCIPDSVAFFRKAAAGAPCAIVSGSPHDDILLAAEACGIRDKLALVLGAGEYAAGKPSPSGYLKAAEILGVNPADCVVVEDSTAGVAAGVAAGMKVVALDRGGTLPQDHAGATWRVKDLLDLDFEKEFAGE